MYTIIIVTADTQVLAQMLMQMRREMSLEGKYFIQL